MSLDRLVRYQSVAVRIQQTLDLAAIARAVAAIDTCWNAGGTLFVAGNGGSATTASHFAADIQKATLTPDRPRLRAIGLADNVALLTAIANDLAYDRVFAEQLLSLGRPGDVLVAISASGNSPNVVQAVRAARELGITVIGLSGFSGGLLREQSDIAIHVPVDSYEIAEDAHLTICHLIIIALKPTFPTPSTRI